MLKVSLSGYHAYLNRKENKNKAVKDYRNKIKELFDQGRGTYKTGHEAMAPS
jgi:hypothetical protein